jgi:hypothetical protein
MSYELPVIGNNFVHLPSFSALLPPLSAKTNSSEVPVLQNIHPSLLSTAG